MGLTGRQSELWTVFVEQQVPPLRYALVLMNKIVEGVTTGMPQSRPFGEMWEKMNARSETLRLTLGDL